MLVLSRQRDETIMIGDEVEITVVDVRGDKVRLGISAPTAVAVHRKEVYEAIEAENARAAGAAVDLDHTGRPPTPPAGTLGGGAAKLVGGRSTATGRRDRGASATRPTTAEEQKAPPLRLTDDGGKARKAAKRGAGGAR